MLVHGPLAKRAWCLQERHLSPRILHVFENRMWIWECDTRVRAANHRGLLFRQDIVDGESPWRKIDFFRQNMVDRKILLRRIAMPNPSPPLDILKLWDNIVIDYCQRQLTYESDKLTAISGIAAKLQLLLRMKYVAGIWDKDMYGLLWTCKSVKCLHMPLDFGELARDFIDRKVYPSQWSILASTRTPTCQLVEQLFQFMKKVKMIEVVCYSNY